MGRHHRDAAAAKSVLAEHEYACARCGVRLGKHKYGTDQCPNPDWRPGNGQSQWLNAVFSDTPAMAESTWNNQGEQT